MTDRVDALRSLMKRHYYDDHFPEAISPVEAEKIFEAINAALNEAYQKGAKKARDMAIRELQMRQRECAEWFRKTKEHANVCDQLSFSAATIACHRLKALIDEQEEEGA